MPIHQAGFMKSGNGGSFEPVARPTSGSLGLGSPTNDPPTQPREAFSKNKIHHVHASPLGEVYVEQIAPNATGQRDSYAATRALPRGTHHGLEQQGDRRTGMANMSAGPDGALMSTPKHTPDPSCGRQYTPDSMKRRPAHG